MQESDECLTAKTPRRLGQVVSESPIAEGFASNAKCKSVHLLTSCAADDGTVLVGEGTTTGERNPLAQDLVTTGRNSTVRMSWDMETSASRLASARVQPPIFGSTA